MEIHSSDYSLSFLAGAALGLAAERDDAIDDIGASARATAVLTAAGARSKRPEQGVPAVDDEFAVAGGRGGTSGNIDIPGIGSVGGFNSFPFLEALLLRLHYAIDIASLWNALQFIITQTAPSDAFALHLNSPGASFTTQATPKAEGLKQWLEHQRKTEEPEPLNLAHPHQPKVYQLSDILFDPRQLPRPEYFRRHLAPKGWHHITRVLFWSEAELTAEVAILRTADQGCFTDREIALLERLHPHIDATIHGVLALASAGHCHVDAGTNLPAAGRERPDNSDSGTTLTATERNLLRLLLTGLSNKEIAAHCHRSIRTVKTQITSIYRKYGVRSRARLLAMMMTQP